MLQNTLSRVRAGRKADDGFTLIELLIVIVILGILAGIVVFSVRGIQDRGDTAACKSNVKSAQVAVEAYYAKTGTYPTAMADLTAGANQFLQEALPAGIVTFGANSATAPTYKLLTAC